MAVRRRVAVPSPSWPMRLSPQAQRLPSLRTARLWPLLAEMAVMPVSPGTWTAVRRSVVVPSPS